MITEIDNLLANATNIYVGADGVARKVVKAYKGVSGVADLVYSAAPASLSYLTFSSDSSFTLNIYDNTKRWYGTLYYSTDTTTWSVWNGTSALSSVNNKLYLRGTGNTRITGSDENYRWVLTGSNISCTGNIETLLDWETVDSGQHPTMANNCYAYMFRGCTSLTTAPALPATTLSERCYYYMFYDCTSLTTAPELPATTMAPYCYSSMFRGCTSLTTAPALPATTLANRCCTSMFQGCTSLTTAPALLATTIATTMATFCYYYMFNGCTALKVSETQTGSYQYAWRIPTAGTGTTATDWSWGMLRDTGGTFKGDPVINVTYYVENLPV